MRSMAGDEPVLPFSDSQGVWTYMVNTASTAHQPWGHPQAQGCSTGDHAIQHEKT